MAKQERIYSNGSVPFSSLVTLAFSVLVGSREKESGEPMNHEVSPMASLTVYRSSGAGVDE